MISGKYAGDYRLNETVLPNGKISAAAEYIGKPFYYAGDKRTVAKARRICAAALCLCWAAFFAALLPQSRAARLMYVLLPFVSAAFPLLYLTESVRQLLRAREPMTREKADRISDGVPRRALFTAALGAAALCGFAVFAVLSPETLLPGDAVFAAAGLIFVLSAILVFRQKSRLRTAPPTE